MRKLRDGEDNTIPLEQEVGESTNEELREARERVKGCNSKLFELAQQLEKEAAEGRVGGSTS